MAQINKPNTYFNTVLYTGTGANQSITGVNFQPDLVWCKQRTNIRDNQWLDAVRGVNTILTSNGADAETTSTTNLLSFDSDGFSLGSAGNINNASNDFVSWNWLASNTTASNTDGSITSTVSANTTSGFSIVSWSGTGANATVGHSLGVAPSMIIVKNRGAGEIWVVYNKTIGATKYLSLNSNIASTTSSTIWNDTEPTSSVFNVGTSEQSNRSGYDMIAYCFAEKQGFSKFGKIQGNGNADGPFCYLGFSPAFLLYKKINGLGDWYFVDNRRPGYNDNNKRLYANTNQAEETYDLINLYSNGFKLTNTTHPYTNDGAGEYLYMAFAEEPLVGDNPATAR